jgi:hypothetical protein
MTVAAPTATFADPKRELTPALIRGSRGSVEVLEEGELAPGLEGTLSHHVFSDGRSSRASTVVLTSVPEGIAFAPALVCRDRKELGGGNPAQLPSERWQPTELESAVFNHRYRLLTLKGQDPVYVREIFSPSLIAWLAHDVPQGFSFELNERHLVVALPGHLEGEEELDELRALAAEVRRRLREEAEEEGEGGNLFDESEKLAKIEAALDVASFDAPPASVGAAMARYRHAARWKPTVILSALFWSLVLFAIAAVAISLFSNPFFGLVAGVLAIPTGFGIGRLMGSSRYRWNGVSVSRLGLERFLREYARSRDLQPQDRWRFHARNRELPLPGVAAHVMDGEIPGTELHGQFVTLGDAAELRSKGTEIAYTSDRPLASIATVVDLGDLALVEALRRVELPQGYKLESAGTKVVIWLPIQGSLLFEAAGFDRFRERSGQLLAQAREAVGSALEQPVPAGADGVG